MQFAVRVIHPSSTMRECARNIGGGRGGRGWLCKFVIGLPVTVADGTLNQTAHSRSVAAQFSLKLQQKNNKDEEKTQQIQKRRLFSNGVRSHDTIASIKSRDKDALGLKVVVDDDPSSG